MTPAQLLDALQAARAQLHGRGGRIRDPHNRTLVNPARLTVRELDVLRLVATGLTDAQIAEQLVISPRTVSWHLSSIYGKIEVSSRAAATRFALEHGLL